MAAWGQVLNVFLTLALVKLTTCKWFKYDDDLPLSRSLGFSFAKFKKAVEEAQLQDKFLTKYQEIIQASREIEGFAEEGERRLRPGSNLDIINDIDNYRDRRHNTTRLPVAIRRRALPRAARRDKLNSQSLRSHMEHTRARQSSLLQPA